MGFGWGWFEVVLGGGEVPLPMGGLRGFLGMFLKKYCFYLTLTTIIIKLRYAKF